MATVKNRPIRPYEQQGRERAFQAARIALSENISQAAAAERCSAKVSSVQEAMLILALGTEDEIAAVERGDIAMGRVSERIRDRTTLEERKSVIRKPVYTNPYKLEGAKLEADIWNKLRDAIDALNGMPSVEDVVEIVRKNAMRGEAVSRKVLPAHTWLEEFVNAWTR